MNKKYFIALSISGFLVAGVSYAHGLDLGVEPGTLPTSPFYFVKEWRRAIQRVFTFNAVKRADLELNILNEKAAETQKISDTDTQNIDAVKTALENYKTAQDALVARLNALKDTSQNPNVDKLLSNLAEKTIKHEKLFADLDEKFKDKTEIKEIIEKAKEKLEKVVSEAARKEKDNSEKLSERFKKEIEEEDEDDEALAERSAHQIKESSEKIAELEKKIAEKPGVSESAAKLLAQAKTHLAKADEAQKAQDFGEAFGQARSAEVLVRNGLRALDDENKGEDNSNNFSEDLDELEKKISKYAASLNEKNITKDSNPEAYKLLESSKQHLGFAKDALAKKDFAGVKLHIGHVKGFLSDLSRIIDSSGRTVKPVSDDRKVNLDTSAAAAVVINENGNFSPSEVKIKKGGKVTWVNKGQNPVWPASNPHPIHTDYPGFDASRGLANGESYSFTFDKVGSWGYHNHLNPGMRGEVKVVE